MFSFLRKLLPIGTRSLLFGSHQFILHPIYVAKGWKKVYGSYPKNWRMYVVFVVHDWGYWGLEEMEGFTALYHPTTGANIAGKLLGYSPLPKNLLARDWNSGTWWALSAYHSRAYAKHMGADPSLLMIPDKLATVLLPSWLLGLMYFLSGEHEHYREHAHALEFSDYPNSPWAAAQWIQAHWGAEFGNN